MTPIPPPATGIGQRLRSTFGPTLAGLFGGALVGLFAPVFCATLCQNMAASYDRFPSLARPWLSQESACPDWILYLAAAVATVAPVCIGAITVWLSRPRDGWEDMSAGLTAALAATLAAFTSCLGWAITLGMVVVPSIADLTTLAEPPSKATETMARRYPDLADVAPDERGNFLMAKVVSDQIAGSAGAVTTGMFTALFTTGSLALAGTLAAGHLARRREPMWRLALPYLEMTLPTATTVALAGSLTGSVSLGAIVGAGGLMVPPLTAVATLMVVAAALRWPWLLRVCLAFTWVAIFAQARQGGAVWLPLLAIVLTFTLLTRQLASSVHPGPAPAG